VPEEPWPPDTVPVSDPERRPPSVSDDWLEVPTPVAELVSLEVLPRVPVPVSPRLIRVRSLVLAPGALLSDGLVMLLFAPPVEESACPAEPIDEESEVLP
jgi:hypothetical protein